MKVSSKFQVLSSLPLPSIFEPDSKSMNRADLLGMYKGGQFKFTFNINPNYPHEPPKVLCTQKVRSDSTSSLAPHSSFNFESDWGRWLTSRSITQISIYQGISVCKLPSTDLETSRADRQEHLKGRLEACELILA
jgi:hypothetical protein